MTSAIVGGHVQSSNLVLLCQRCMRRLVHYVAWDNNSATELGSKVLVISDLYEVSALTHSHNQRSIGLKPSSLKFKVRAGPSPPASSLHLPKTRSWAQVLKARMQLKHPKNMIPAMNASHVEYWVFHFMLCQFFGECCSLLWDCRIELGHHNLNGETPVEFQSLCAPSILIPLITSIFPLSHSLHKLVYT